MEVMMRRVWVLVSLNAGMDSWVEDGFGSDLAASSKVVVMGEAVESLWAE
jgi:hypothetical protein